jgi:hypothetical protein
MATKKVVNENVVDIIEQNKSKTPTPAQVFQKIKREQLKQKEIRAKYMSVEVKALNLKDMYLFEFNKNVKKPALRNKKMKISGELAMYFIRRDYGILC